jgi:UPF0755 protein
MADDWDLDDPFADPADPESAAREERRREREEKRRKRQGKEPEAPEAPDPEASAPQPPPPPEQPPPPPQPPVPPRTAEEEFWDEDPEPYEEEEEELPPAAPPPGGRPPRGPRKPRPGAGVLAAIVRHPFRLVAVLVALVAVWFLVSLFQPFHGDGSGRVVVQVPKGSGVGEVGDLLDQRGVISNSTFFQLRVTLAGDRSNLKAGRFVLAHDMSYGSAIEALTKSPVKKVSSVTIPEGFNRKQTAALVAESGFTGSYLKESVHSKYLNPAKYGGKNAKNLEGFLFPDTFEVKPGGPAADLVQLQLQDFEGRIKGVEMKYARSKNLTTYDVLTIASMVQAESGNPDQDALVAGVIYNRLHEGMPLGIDATVRFATGNYESPLTESELATDSPYNTRLNQGLPPGPINSPGLEAIEAAAHPSKKDYLFYVTKPGGCNELVFAKTEAEFESDVARYNSAREAAGGNSPTTC